MLFFQIQSYCSFNNKSFESFNVKNPPLLLFRNPESYFSCLIWQNLKNSQFNNFFIKEEMSVEIFQSQMEDEVRNLNGFQKGILFLPSQSYS